MHWNFNGVEFSYSHFSVVEERARSITTKVVRPKSHSVAITTPRVPTRPRFSLPDGKLRLIVPEGVNREKRRSWHTLLPEEFVKEGSCETTAWTIGQRKRIQAGEMAVDGNPENETNFLKSEMWILKTTITLMWTRYRISIIFVLRNSRTSYKLFRNQNILIFWNSRKCLMSLQVV